MFDIDKYQRQVQLLPGRKPSDEEIASMVMTMLPFLSGLTLQAEAEKHREGLVLSYWIFVYYYFLVLHKAKTERDSEWYRVKVY